MGPRVPRLRRSAVAHLVALGLAPLVFAPLVFAPISAAAQPAPEPPPPSEAPTAGLVHEPIATGQRGNPIAIAVGVQSELVFTRLILAYRADGEREFRGREMKRVAPGMYRGEIPSQATLGATVAYYVEAQDKDGAPVAARASAADPLVVDLTGPRRALTLAREAREDDEAEESAPAHPFFVALLVGSGAGWAAGNGDTNADTTLQPSSIALARLGQLAPEVGYWLTPTLMLSVQGRFQAVTGTTDVYENGRVYHTARYAAAGFFKATWVAAGHGDLHPFFSLAAGGGQIRHVVSFEGLTTCGPRHDQVCVDTIAAGPVAAGPGGGVMAELGHGLSFVFQLNTQLTLPEFSYNVDANVGVALRL